jgi:hypothetical protein
MTETMERGAVHVQIPVPRPSTLLNPNTGEVTPLTLSRKDTVIIRLPVAALCDAFGTVGLGSFLERSD